MTSKRFWMPLYIGTYLKNTTHLRALESGAYLHLIMAYWLDGRLPNNDRQLATIAKVTDKEWKRIKSTMAAFFGPDFSSHERIDAELARAADVSAKRKEAARVKWDKEDAKGDAQVMQMHMQKPCTTDAILQTTYTKEEEGRKAEVALRAPPAKKGTRLSEDWEPSGGDLAYAKAKGFDRPAALNEAEKFRNYWLSKAGNNTKLDWKRTWQYWISNSNGGGNGRVQNTGTGNILPAQDRLIERVRSFDAPIPDDARIRGGEGENIVRLLPKG
jgi:uncharacterized protein YdaU (DUF1376 family)